MRFSRILFSQLLCVGLATVCLGLAKAQTPARTAPAKAGGAAATTARPPANLAQLMRGVLFPSSNIIFFAQSKDPDAVAPAPDPSVATDPLSNSYGKWAAVENSGLAIAESATLLNVPGRVCSNGRAVPLKNPDWPKFVQALRESGITAYKAAQTKDQDKMLDAADAVTTACTNCHNRYREKPNGVADRCM
jgi:hypothetical protein